MVQCGDIDASDHFKHAGLSVKVNKDFAIALFKVENLSNILVILRVSWLHNLHLSLVVSGVKGRRSNHRVLHVGV